MPLSARGDEIGIAVPASSGDVHGSGAAVEDIDRHRATHHAETNYSHGEALVG
jgi:hypothetical protein